MKIIWLGHSGFRIETGDQVLLVDPWLRGNPSFDEARFDEADACRDENGSSCFSEQPWLNNSSSLNLGVLMTPVQKKATRPSLQFRRLPARDSQLARWFCTRLYRGS